MNGELYPGEFEAMERQGRLDAVIPEQKMMTSEEAIGNLKYAIRWNDMPKKEALEMAMTALEQEPKAGHCKDCKYFKYNNVTRVDGIPLIMAHEICSRWSGGCKTKEDGYCFLFEPQEEQA